MNVFNMERLPVSVQKAVKPFLEDLLAGLNDNVVSIFVHGSATGEDYDAKTSDINIGFVLKDVSISAIKSVIKKVRTALKKKITVPLFLSQEYINKSLDTFPMEFLEMKETGIVVYGENVLDSIDVKKEDLRRECEYQLKGKLITIRQAFLEQALSRRGLEILLKQSLNSLFPVFRTILRLKADKTLVLNKEETLEALSGGCKVDVSSFMEVYKDKKSDGRIGGKPAEEFIEAFLIELNRLSEIVDEM
jgi:hypothetical protein